VGETIHRKLLRHTPSLAAIADSLALAATHDVTVLLTGETGTGKTHLARLIHNSSRRGAEPLLVVPCGALSAGLLESELFGHAKGAFTGAAGPKVGKFEAAAGGTLLLDEIDTLELEAQAALLRRAGCTFAQGFLYDHPRLPEDLDGRLSRRHLAVASTQRGNPADAGYHHRQFSDLAALS